MVSVSSSSFYNTDEQHEYSDAKKRPDPDWQLDWLTIGRAGVSTGAHSSVSTQIDAEQTLALNVQKGSVRIQDDLVLFLDSGRKCRPVIHLYLQSMVLSVHFDV